MPDDKELQEKLKKLIEELFPPESEPRDPWGISKSFYAVLGLIVAEWARAEDLLGDLCYFIFEIDPPIGVPRNYPPHFRGAAVTP